MKHQLLKLTYIRKRDRKSLLFVISILLFSSFSDEVFLMLRNFDSESKQTVTEIAKLTENKPVKQTHILRSDEISLNLDHQTKPSQKTEQKESVKESGALSTGDKVATLSKKTTNNNVETLPTKPIRDLSTIIIDTDQPDINDLVAIGIPKKIAYTWSKYASAGGKIQEKEDLQKIYGIEDEHVEKINKHIRLPSSMKCMGSILN